MAGKNLRVQSDIFCVIPLKSWSNDDDRLVDMQQKIESLEEKAEREEQV